MPVISSVSTAWGVRTVLRVFIEACRLYNKHRDRCEHFLPAEVCTTLASVCAIINTLDFILTDGLPPVGTRE